MMEIEKISGPLRELLCEKEIIARCELLLRTYDIVSAANLSDQESDELKKMVGEHIAPGIFASIMNGEAIFFDLPKLDTYTQMNGRIFHFLHTQRYSKQDFDDAHRRFLLAIPELKSILKKSLVRMLKAFMEDAGYILSSERSEMLIFTAAGRTLQAFVVTSVKSIDLDSCGQKMQPEADCVILVPSGESLEPFMQFFREKGQMAEEKGISIWLANMEKGTIDPFIGYTTDMDIYEQFNNPRLAEMVRNNWTKKPRT